MGESESWLALSLIPGVGGGIARILFEEFGSADTILHASRSELESVQGIGPTLSKAIHRGPDLERLKEEKTAIQRAGARTLGLGDEGYPPILREIVDPPPVLYLLGRDLSLEKPRIGMVGTREPTREGLAVAHRLARALASSGVEVVSGMARGIDSACHLGALEGQGTTVAVLGCGVDVLYPMRRRPLRDQIAEGGTLVSEFPMRTTPIPEFFPRRNRIISGLSLGVIVVEAAERSGALLTANLALDQGRDVMAVPGSPSVRLSSGPNRLIQEGAKLVMTVEDVLEEIQLEHYTVSIPPEQPEPPPKPEGLVERKILKALESGEGLVDEIAERIGCDVPAILERLLAMELRGLVRRTAGARYERV